MATQKMTNQNLMNVFAALSVLGSTKFPLAASITLARITAKVRAEVEPVERTKNDVIKELGEKDAAGVPTIKPNTPAMAVFAEKLQEIMDGEVEIDLPKIDYKDLGTVDLQPNVLEVLDGVVFVEKK